jgi:hypothetical protein
VERSVASNTFTARSERQNQKSVHVDLLREIYGEAAELVAGLATGARPWGFEPQTF